MRKSHKDNKNSIDELELEDNIMGKGRTYYNNNQCAWIYPVILLLLIIFVLQYKPAIFSNVMDKNEVKIIIDKEINDHTNNDKVIRYDREKIFPDIIKLSDNKKLRILITGGAGFVGSHLVDRLMKEGHEVNIIDNFFTGRIQNVEHWEGHHNFQLINHDVVEEIMLEVDQIYHLACPASPPHYQFNPIKTIKTNTRGTLNMLGLAKRVRARMLLASTSEVYGDPQVNPQSEDYWGNVNPIGPRACYDEGKRVAETMMYAYSGQSGLEVRVARIFNTFGPRMHQNDGRVVSNFIIEALQGKDLTIYGSGKQTRSFQYVDDLVNGLIMLMNGNYSNPVNIGNPDEYSVHDFAKLIIQLTNSTSTIKFLPATQDDPHQRRPDITVAKKNLGWEPSVKVKDGLMKTIEYFKTQLKTEGDIEPTGQKYSRTTTKMSLKDERRV